MDHVLDVGLPKWPQMRVWGPAITPQRAAEIIVRTDSFFAWNGLGGNNHGFDRGLCHRLGLPYQDYGRSDNWEEIYQAWDAFRKEIGFIPTEYVHNGWISNAFIFGPSGWCHPDGTIHFVHNVGKWPSVQEVLDDWARIAAAWPFLDLDACLMNEESGHDEDDGPSVPLAVIQVSGGTARAFLPADYAFLSRFGEDQVGFRTPDLMTSMLPILSGRLSRENHFSISEVAEMVRRVRERRAAA